MCFHHSISSLKLEGILWPNPEIDSGTYRRVKRNWRSWLKVAQNLLNWHKNIAKEPWTDALCVCVCVFDREVCECPFYCTGKVWPLVFVDAKNETSLLKWHQKIGDVSIDSCGLVVVGWSHDFNPGQSCHVVQAKNQDLRISRTTSQRLGPKGRRPDVYHLRGLMKIQSILLEIHTNIIKTRCIIGSIHSPSTICANEL